MAETTPPNGVALEQGSEQSSQKGPENQDLTSGQPKTTMIPEKFKGKSFEDVLEAYVNLEKHAGKLSSERDHALKEKDEWATKYSQMESTRQQVLYQESNQPRQQAPADVDPISYLEEHFDEDPKKAIRESLKRTREEVQRQTQQAWLNTQAQQASEYYYSQKRDNPDFARREPIMQQLVKEYGDIIRPEMLNSSKVLKALDIMSRGHDVDYYSQEAVKRATKEGLSSREEKQRAQTESSSTEGDRQIDFGKLSMEDMKKLLGRADD